MLLYHGSLVAVEQPQIRVPQAFLDFGAGFYLTSSHEQALRWAQVKMRRSENRLGYVSIYDFDLSSAEQNTAIRKFASADLYWLNFVINNRRGIPQDEAIDMHIGPVADDNVYKSIRLFETQVIDAEETVKRLKTEILQDQWVLHTEKALSYLRFQAAEEVKEED